MAASATARPVDQAAIDQGLRSYMLRVFNYMGSGLLLSGIVAVAFAQWIGTSPREEIVAFYSSGLYMIAAFAPIGILLLMSFASKRLSATAMQGLYWVFTALMGVSLSSVFFRYGMGDITRVFFITAITFGAMSLWGYTTKRDLSGWGSFLFMGLIGIIVASIVNIFMQSTMMHFVISVIGVLVFTGLTAYDTQRIKSEFVTYRMEGGIATKSAVMGAVSLYLNFLNLFYLLLALFGNRE
jgi:hypothetical protein